MAKQNKPYTTAAVFIILVGLIIVIGSQIGSNVEINQEKEKVFTNATFSSLQYTGQKELLIDCTYYSNGYCYAGMDSDKGWVSGPLHEEAFSDLYDQVKTYQQTNISVLKLTDQQMDTYFLQPDEEEINSFIEETSPIVYNASEMIINKAKQDQDIQDCMQDTYSTFFMQPYIKDSQAVWKVGIGSPANPKEYVYVSFDGESLL